ncbi:DUF1440 domain-containing protein [Chitinophaga sp. Cy-1792]|uniref:DUF1440 domain-containing protein n=1 Tax=Chitinophaga sp. Cy-1792 TaxID=2608339 RepID=UPI0014200B26|nr:DUF1440 domain-containing protein [Chitinophaga sp. Cy-1792]NIG55174.1 hypothetical protein [Chitinophaga sp. Cy-1792]
MEKTRQYGKITTPIIAGAALLAGTLDLVTTLIMYVLRTHRPFTDILLFISSALFGPAAFSGHKAMPWFGVLIHYAIAFVFSTLFFVLYPLIRKGIRNTFLIAVLYGCFIWVIMNLVVLPMTHVKPVPITTFGVAVGAGILILMIGLPLAIIANKVSKPATA